jgi:ketosteroid isomerase-like protein
VQLHSASHAASITNVPSPSEPVLRAKRAFDRGDVSGVVAEIHPDAVIQSYAAGGAPLRGPEAVRESFTAALDTVYRVVYEHVEDLDATTAITSGTVRFVPREGTGHVMRRATWLWVVEDDRIISARLFTTEDEAREAWKAGDARFVLPDDS